MSPKTSKKRQTPPTDKPKPAATPPKPSSAPPTSVENRFIVDTILPRHELHIIGGPAHSGKTSLQFLMMDDIRSGRNVFGYPSHRVPFCYVSCVHSLAASKATLSRLEIDPIPMISVLGSKDARSFDQIYASVTRVVPNVEVIFLDGILHIAGNSGMDNAVVGAFLSELVTKLAEYRVTLIATGRCAKPKDNRTTIRSIDRFLGATAWTEFSSTFIAIDPKRPNNPRDDRRIVTVMPKNALPSTLQYRFASDGKLVEVSEDPTADSPDRIEVLSMLINARPAGTEITTAELLDMGREDVGVLARSSMMAYIRVLIQRGQLLDAGHGKYRVPTLQ